MIMCYYVEISKYGLVMFITLKFYWFSKFCILPGALKLHHEYISWILVIILTIRDSLLNFLLPYMVRIYYQNYKFTFIVTGYLHS